MRHHKNHLWMLSEEMGDHVQQVEVTKISRCSAEDTVPDMREYAICIIIGLWRMNASDHRTKLRFLKKQCFRFE